ncbi:hypothetical protein ACHAXT_009318 [Thalassiosira profunda]
MWVNHGCGSGSGRSQSGPSSPAPSTLFIMASGAPHTDDFLGGDFAATRRDSDSQSAGEPSTEADPPQRPMQLPKVGWGDDDPDDGTDGQCVALEYTKRADKDDGSIVSRANSRSSVGLESIPEDMSMHGGWDEYYPDIMGCYDYDEDRKKYQYRRCGPKFKRRMCAVLLIAFAAIVGSRVSSKMHGKSKRLPGAGANSDSDAGGGRPAPPQTADGASSDYPPDAKAGPPGEDIHTAIVDSLHPLQFDSTSKWDGTYFNAFKFCGAEYSRVPCPYIAYCPLGPGNAPLGGVKISTAKDGSWAPVFNSQGDENHDWVQLGSDGTCELYSRLYHHERPPWGDEATADGEEISRHVMCCLESVDGTYQGDDRLGLPSNDPDHIDRPPQLEEDAAGRRKVTVRENEEGKSKGGPGNRRMRRGHRP